MNRSYRLVWSRRLGSYVAVAETTRSRGKQGRAGATIVAAAMAFAAQGALAQASATAPPANALPVGATLQAGQASVQTQGSTLTVNQTSARAVLNWQQFNVGKDATVNFVQPGSSSVALNRVTGADASVIAGRINANGQVVLVNPNGVLFAKGSRADVGGIVASTMDVSDADFMAGKLNFKRNGSTASVVNEGELNVAEGGAAALLAADVLNNGIVRATRGVVVLASGEAVTLNFNGGAVSVLVDPSNIQALVQNRQLVQAEGGQVVMTARAANALLGAAINNSGTVSASSLVAEGGSVRLVADHLVQQGGTVSANGTRGGTVEISAASVSLLSVSKTAPGVTSATGSSGAGGSVSITSQRQLQATSGHVIDASGSSGGRVAVDAGAGSTGGTAIISSAIRADGSAGNGGQVTLTGNLVGLLGAPVSADGSAAGGSILLGGDWQGKGTLAHADTVYANATTTLSARGGSAGGKVVAWSDTATHFDGQADVRAADASGSGGAIEMSSKGDLGFSGKALAGVGGTVLLDPTNLLVSDNYSWSFLGRVTGNANFGNNSGAGFGTSVAIDGDLMVVGAPNFAYFANNGAVFSFTGVTSSSGLAGLSYSGVLAFEGCGVCSAQSAFGMDPTTGAAPTGGRIVATTQNGDPLYQIYAWGPGEGGYFQTAFYPIADQANRQQNARFGASVALRNGVLAVGAPGITDYLVTGGGTVTTADVGAVFMYDTLVTGYTFDASQRRVIVTGASTSLINNNSGWGFYESGAKSTGGAFVPGGANHQFGASVALDGDKLVVGAPGADSGRGQVYTFSGVGNTQLLYPQAVVPAPVFSTPFSGYAMVNGGNYDPTLGGGAGGLYDAAASSPWDSLRYVDLVYRGAVLNNGQAGSFSITGTAGFGKSVALNGDLLAIGAPGSGGAANGAVYLFNNVGSNFAGLTDARALSASAGISGLATPQAGSGFGSAVALAEDTTPGGLGGTLVIGEAGANKAHMLTFGAGSGWGTLGYLHEISDPTLPNGANFGLSLGMNASGSLLAVGSWGGAQHSAVRSDTTTFDATLALSTAPNQVQGQVNAAIAARTQLLAPYTYTGPTQDSAPNNGPLHLSMFERSGAVGTNALASLPGGGSGTTFTTANGNTSGVTAKSIAATLASGTNVTLQASNDITWVSEMTVAPQNGVTPGTLTLQAGRNVNINAKIATGGGSMLVAAGDPGAVSGQTLAGTPTVSFGAAGLAYGEYTGYGYFNVITNNYATAGYIDLGGSAGAKGDVALVAAGGWLRAMVATPNPYNSNTVSLSPFVNQSTWLVHVADKRDQATTSNTSTSVQLTPEDLTTSTAAVRRYTVTSGLPGATGNYYPLFAPVDTYNAGAQTGSSVSLATYTGRWLGTANGAFSFGNRGASFNFINPWFDMASNYALGYSQNAAGQIINDGGAVQTVAAGRRVDSGWSQEFQPTIYVQPAPVVGIYGMANDLNPAVGNTASPGGITFQYTGFVDGDFFQVATSTTNAVTIGTVAVAQIRGNNGQGYTAQGLATGAPAPFNTSNAGYFDTTRVPTSQAAGGSQTNTGTAYDISLNAAGTAALKAGMTYGSGKLTNARTNTTASKYVFVDNTTSTGEYTQLPFTLPAFYTPVTKAYNVGDTMQLTWNTPSGGASGTGVITGNYTGGTAIVWGGNSSTPGYIGDLSYNASTKVYTYSHAGTGDVYTVTNQGNTGVIGTLGFAGTSPVYAIGQSGNTLANGTVAPLGSWLSLPGGQFSSTNAVLQVNSAVIDRVSGAAGNNFRMAAADGTITLVPLNFTASRPYDGTTVLSPGDIKTLAGYDPLWAPYLSSANGSIGTSTPRFQLPATNQINLFNGTATTPTQYATNGGPVSGITPGSLALGSYVNGGYYLDFTSPSSTVGISPLQVNVSALKTYDTGLTITGNAAGNLATNNGISITSGNANSSLNAAVNALIAADFSGSRLSMSGSVATADKTANATTSGAYLSGMSGKVLDLSNLSLSGAAAGSYFFNPTASANTAKVKQAPLTVGGVTITQRVFDNTTNAPIATYGSLSGGLSGDNLTLTTSGAVGTYADPNVGNNKPVTITGYTAGGTDLGNYAFTQPVGVTGNIGPLALMGSWTRIYNGSTAFTASGLVSGTNTGGLVFTLTGVPTGATAPTLTGTVNASAKDVGSYSLATGGLTLNQSVPGTYTLTSLTGTITAKPLTLSFSVPNKVYDATTNVVGSVTVNGGTVGSPLGAPAGVVSGDSVTLGGSASYAFASANAGTAQQVNISGLSLTGAQAGNYSLANAYAGATANIAVKPLTWGGVSAPNSRVYNGTTAAVVSGTPALLASVANGSTAVDGKPYAGDISGGLALTGTATGTYNNANVSGATSITFGGVTLTSAAAANYVLSPLTQTASITPLATTVTGRKDYSGTNSFSLAQLFDVAGNALSTTGATMTSATVASANASTWNGSAFSTQPLTITGLNLGSNYTLSGSGNNAVIAPKVVTLTGGHVYDGSSNAAASTLTAATGVTGQSLTLTGIGTVADRNVGNKATGFAIGTLALGNGAGGLASNYMLSPTLAMGYGFSGPQISTYTVTAKPVTLTAPQLSRQFDATTTATAPANYLSTTLTNALGVSGDTVSAGTLAFTSANAGSGNRTVALSGVTIADGNNGANYAVTLQNNTSSTITQAPVSFTTSAVSKTYDGSTAASGGTISIAAGQLYGASAFSGGTLSFANKDVARDVNGNVLSNKTLNLSGVSITDAGNYAISYVANTASTINPAALAITGTHVYDATTAFAGSALTARGVTVGGTQESFAISGAGAAGNLASKDVQSNQALASLTGLSLGSGSNGAVVGNYTALSTSGSQVSVTPATLNVTGSRTYDGSTALAGNLLTASGIGGESFAISGSGATGNLASRNVGTGLSLASYSGLSLGTGAGGALVGNYQLLAASTSSVGITAKAVTLTAPVISKVYDATTGYSASAGDLGALSAALGINGDSISAITLAYTNANAGSGNRSVTASNATVADGNGGANYAVSYSGNSTSTITPAALVLSGTRTYNGTAAMAGSVLTATGVAGQTFTLTGSGLLTSGNAGVSTLGSVGSLALGASGNGGVSSNYLPLVAGGSFTIGQGTLVLSGSRVYDTTTSFGGGVLTAVGANGETFAVNGNGASGNLASANVQSGSGLASLAGLTLGASGNGGLSSNYTALGTAGSQVNVTPAALVLSGTRTYDGSTTAGGLTATGVNGQSFAVTGSGTATSANAGTQALASVAGLALGSASGGALSSNYQVLGTAGSAYVITPKAVTLTAPVVAKTYDGGLTYVLSASDLLALTGQLGVNGDSISGATLAYTNANAGSGNKTVALSAAQVAGNSGGAGNYAISYGGNSTSSINQAFLLVTGSRVYDASTGFAGGVLTAQGAAGESFALGGSGVLANANVQSGQQLANIGTLALGAASGGALSSNYRPIDATHSSVSVTPATLSVNPTAVYTGSTALQGNVLVVNGVGGQTFTMTGTGTMTGANVGSQAMASNGTLALGTSGNGGLSSNYLALAPLSGLVTITPATLTLSGSQVYDGSTVFAGNNLVASGVNGETFNVNGGGAFGNLANANVQSGSALASLAGLTLGTSGNGGLASNYTALGTAGSQVDVTPATLVLNGTRSYDGGTTAGGLTATGVNGEAFAVTGNGSVASANAGTQALASVAGLALGNASGGALVSNYQALATTGSAYAITPKALTLTAPIVAKTYDGGLTYVLSAADLAALTAQLGVSGDSISGATLAYTNANAGSGNKTVALSGAQIAGSNSGGANNYAISYAGNSASTINQATLVLSGARVYDGSTAVAGLDLLATGVAGETFALSGSGDTSNLASRNVGTAGLQSVTGLALGNSANGGLASNYTALTAQNASVVTTARAVVLVAGDVTKTYDTTTTYVITAADLAALTAQLGVAGDSVSMATLDYTDANAGSRNKTVMTSAATVADGNGGANYAVTYANNTSSTIDRANLVLAGNGNRVYNGSTALAGSLLTAVGVGGQTFAVTGAGAAGNLASANVQANQALASVAGLALGTSANGGNASNYNVLGTTGSQVSVTPATLVLTGTRVYDGSTAVAGSSLVASGVAGETFAVSGNGAANNLASRNVGTAGLQSLAGLALGNSANGGLVSNYTVLTTQNSQVVTTPKAVVLTAPLATKAYDGSSNYAASAADMAALTAQLGVSGDSVGAAAMAFAAPTPGTQAVAFNGATVADGNGGQNYVVTLAGNANGQITGTAGPSVTATPQAVNALLSQVAGAAATPPAAVSSGSVGGLGSISGGAAPSSAAVAASVVASGGAGSGGSGYSLATGGAVVLTPAAPAPAAAAAPAPAAATAATAATPAAATATATATATGSGPAPASAPAPSPAAAAAVASPAAAPAPAPVATPTPAATATPAPVSAPVAAPAPAPVPAATVTTPAPALVAATAPAQVAVGAPNAAAPTAPAPAAAPAPVPAQAVAQAVAPVPERAPQVVNAPVVVPATPTPTTVVAAASPLRTLAPVGGAPGASDGFVAVRQLVAVAVSAGSTAEVRLPADTFQHSIASEKFELSATLADGSPLPAWVRFDSAAGTFTLQPPDGANGVLQVVVVARDTRGKRASTALELDVGDTKAKASGVAGN